MAFSKVFPSPVSLSLFLVLVPLIDIRFLYGTGKGGSYSLSLYFASPSRRPIVRY